MTFNSTNILASFNVPDAVHKLPQSGLLTMLLAYMTRVDNELTVEEMAMFEQRLGTTYFPQNKEIVLDTH